MQLGIVSTVLCPCVLIYFSGSSLDNETMCSEVQVYTDNFQKSGALTFHRNVSENWQSFSQQHEILGNQKRDDPVKIVALLSCAVKNATEVFK